VPETSPKFAQPVVTPALGTFQFPVPTVLGQLSVVSATHTAPTVPLNLRTVPQAMSNVVSSSVVVPGAAVSTAACTAPNYLVPVANTQLPVKPPAGTMPTLITKIPTQTSIVSSVPPVATSINVPPVVTTISVPPVVTSAPPVANHCSGYFFDYKYFRCPSSKRYCCTGSANHCS